MKSQRDRHFIAAIRSCVCVSLAMWKILKVRLPFFTPNLLTTVLTMPNNADKTACRPAKALFYDVQDGIRPCQSLHSTGSHLLSCHVAFSLYRIREGEPYQCCGYRISMRELYSLHAKRLKPSIAKRAPMHRRRSCNTALRLTPVSVVESRPLRVPLV